MMSSFGSVCVEHCNGYCATRFKKKKRMAVEVLFDSTFLHGCVQV